MVATSRKGEVTVSERVRGFAMLRHFTVRGTTVSLRLSEALLASALVWWGLVLLPGGPEPAAPISTTFAVVMPPQFWAIIALWIGTPQLIGMALTWFGIAPPNKLVRLVMLGCTVWWWSMLAIGCAFSGLAIAPVTYTVFALMAARNFRVVDVGI